MNTFLNLVKLVPKYIIADWNGAALLALPNFNLVFTAIQGYLEIEFHHLVETSN